MDVPLVSFLYHAINIYLYVLPNLVGEHTIHESLVGGTNILKADEHDIVVVVIVFQHEGSIWGIKGIRMKLVIPLNRHP